ncbi:MAG: universal stress protein [Actinomycetota bacterium]|nr:universal stress protein [Actinomycetota bacterium]
MSVLVATPANEEIDNDRGGRAPARVLVVYDASRSGKVALREAAQLTQAGGELSVVTLAPQARPLRCCGGGGAGPYNFGVRGEAEAELRQAREALGTAAGRATFAVLVGCPDPPLTAWVAEHAFDLVLLPCARLTRGGSRFARGLRAATAAEVRLVR